MILRLTDRKDAVDLVTGHYLADLVVLAERMTLLFFLWYERQFVGH
jgi:hypothetical protein